MAPELRPVFYPAVLGWILLSTWIATIRYRLRKIENKQFNTN
jgi:heme exporter protein C